MNRFAVRCVCLATFLTSGTLTISRAEDVIEQPKISFQRQVEPIFRVNCQGCHQPAKAQGGFDMTLVERMLLAGESEEVAVVPGQPDASYLMAQITPVDGSASMPKNTHPLNDSEIDIIRRWIAEGAKDDSTRSGPQFDAEHPPEYTRPPIITTLKYSPDGRRIAVNGFQEVLLLDADTLQVTQRLIGLSERIESLSFSPDSQRLAVTGGSPGTFGEVQVWNVESGQLELSHRVSYDTIAGGTFSPDGKLVAFGCTDNTLRAIDAESGQQVLHQGAHDDWIRSCVFTPDGKYVLSASRDMTVKLTELATQRFVDNVTSITPGALRGGVNSLAMHPERNEFLVGGADGTPKVYRVFRETERRIGDDANLIRQFPAMKGRIFSVDVDRTGSYLAAASTLDGQSWLTVYPYNFDGKLPEDVKAAMAKTVASRSKEELELVEAYNSKVPDAILSRELEGNSVYAIAFSPDGKKLAFGGGDGRVRVLDVDAATLVGDALPVTIVEGGLAQSTNAADAVKAGRGLRLPDDAVPPRDQPLQLVTRTATKLTVSPHEIRLADKRSYVQLVVTAEFPGGEALDVTRLAELNASQSHVNVSELGLVRPDSVGRGELRISFGERQVIVPTWVESTDEPQQTDFVRDVNPLLSRLGCNAGTCHGAQKGKNGFKLSLRGYDPLEDIRALSDDLCSRRLDSAAPDASLMLRKMLGLVPHEGGVLLTDDSAYYQTIRSWIAEGAQLNRETQKVQRIELFPSKPVIERENSWQQFRVVAFYPDGTQRDVTQEAFIESGNTEICLSYPEGRVKAIRRGEAPVLARYEGAYAASTVTVMGDRSDFAWQPTEANNTIDRLVAEKWARMKIAPSDVCDDSEFLRRVRLDLTGLPPTVEEFKSFLADLRPSKVKRRAKIDELIGNADYVEHWTNKWSDLLQVNSKFIGADGAKAFRDWIRQAIADNQPYDEFVHSILTATGSNKENPAASYYKILRDPDLMMENTTHLFLAVRFNCNKCHDHPFERWTQDQYYELAAYFAQTGLKEDPASKGKKIGGTAVEGAKPLYEEVVEKPGDEIMHPRTGAPVTPAFPFDCERARGENQTRREQLAAWVTSPDNPYFARSFVNRMWGYMTGTGLMTPLDDLRAGNPPTNPELLEHLTREFLESGFDVEHVLRLICNSRTYQLSVSTNQWNDDDSLNYSHAKARRLPAEVLYDAVYRVTGAVSDIPGVAPGTRAAALPDVALQLPDGFLNNLGRPVRESACECERSDDLQLGPVMALVSGPTIGKAISDPQCALPGIAKRDMAQREMIREIYMRVLSRDATEAEIDAVQASVDQIAADHARLTDQLAQREAWWVEERAKREELRLASLSSVKLAIETRTLEIADERTKMEEDRVQALQRAKEKLKEFEANSLQLAGQYLDKDADSTTWFPLAAVSATTSNKAVLIPQEDRSIAVSGDASEATYTVTYRTTLNNIRGVRLEALPLADDTSRGPGLAENGNFVVTELEIEASPVSETSSDKISAKNSKAIMLKSAKADFSQDGFAPEQVFDGQSKNQRGWAVSPRGGTTHWITFETTEPVSNEGEMLLTFKIYQYHSAKDHRLARFRISVTTDLGEIGLSLPESLAAAKTIPAKARDAKNLAQVIGYLNKSDANWEKLRQAVVDANKPLPEDEQLVGLKKRLKALEVETADDPRLVQLRNDFKASQEQVGNQRLTLAQDLTWALINSPAFLFNH
ncbi:MAG: DUF1549 domain-containing protein [Planctomycetales bacterium]|nr:DUF1549 domain-containing protein [Planctomycetales bacterium]